MQEDRGGGRMLVLLPPGVEPRETLEKRLTAFWGLAGIESLSLERFVPAVETPADGVLAALAVRGQWMGEAQSTPVEEEREVLGLLEALLGFVEKSFAAGHSPVLEPSLLWTRSAAVSSAVLSNAREWSVAAALAVPARGEDEGRLVRELASLVYWRASGVELAAARKASPSPLSRWCKKVGPALSSTIGRCLEPDSITTRIASFAALRNALAGAAGRPMSATGASNRPVGITSAPAVGDAKARGLGRVAGMVELKSLLVKEVVRAVRDPEPFIRYGLTIPNGILLYGPPGCGKTWIARALAEEIGHYFVEIIPSEVASPYIHDSTLRIRELFDTAAEKAPAVLFIDEFEALVPSRADLGGHQQYKSEEVNEFLTHLNACAEKKIFVIAATNEPQKIDAAVRRTGRLDKLIYVGPPDLEARAEMLKLHLGKRPLASDLDLARLATTLEGYSASDIKFLVDEAARDALDALVPISNAILEKARARVPASVRPEDESRFRSFVGRGS